MSQVVDLVESTETKRWPWLLFIAIIAIIVIVVIVVIIFLGKNSPSTDEPTTRQTTLPSGSGSRTLGQTLNESLSTDEPTHHARVTGSPTATPTTTPTPDSGDNGGDNGGDACESGKTCIPDEDVCMDGEKCYPEDNGNGDDEEEEKYDIISPWWNRNSDEAEDIEKYQDTLQATLQYFEYDDQDPPEVMNIGNPASCLERNEERNEELNEEGDDLLEFSWSTFDQRKQARNSSGDDLDFPPCLMWPEGMENPSGNDNDNKNSNTYMFRPSQEGIDLNKWNVHLGIKNKSEECEVEMSLNLDECATLTDALNKPTFVYNFEDRKCFPKQEINPKIPWGADNYYPGALFVSKQSPYDFVSTDGTTCEDVGMDFVDGPPGDCEDAAEALGLSFDNIGEISDPDRPWGCYWNSRKEGGTLNRAFQGSKSNGTQIAVDEGQGGGSRLQICKRRSL